MILQTRHDVCVYPMFIVCSSGMDLENQIRETHLPSAFRERRPHRGCPSTVTDPRAISAIDGGVLLWVVVTRI